jgi:undecaprenyl-diphosphatase
MISRLSELRRQWIARLTHEQWSPQLRFGVQLALGTVVLLIAAWIFGVIAEDVVTGDPLTLVDRMVANWLHTLATPILTRAMLLIAELAGARVITALAVTMGLALAWKRRWHWLLALVLVVPGGVLLNELLKIAFRRARPTFDEPILVLTDYGFPSGHTMIATILYGFIGLFLVTIVHSWRWRRRIVVAVVVLVALVGVSRMYLGVHYLSDILAAIAAGGAWLALCLTAVATLRHRGR